MFQALAKALGQFDDPRIGHVIWKSLAWALVVLAVLGVVFWYLGDWMAGGLAHWVDWVAHIGTVLLTLLLIFFLFPVAVTTVVSFYSEAVASAVEARHYPGRPPPRDQPLSAIIMGALRFAGVAIFLNLLLVPIYLVLLVFPPLYLVVFYAVNGYLLGREYFELVAYRRLEERAADAMRRTYWGRVTLAGVVMAVMLTIPVFNLVAPIAATAFALHLFEAMRRGQPQAGRRPVNEKGP